MIQLPSDSHELRRGAGFHCLEVLLELTCIGFLCLVDDRVVPTIFKSQVRAKLSQSLESYCITFCSSNEDRGTVVLVGRICT
jgi:hypothetical protein